VKNLADGGLPAAARHHHSERDESVAIFDAKWKRLDLGEPNSGVSSGDAYQMNAYASRYRCKRLALVYPASRDCPPGRITEFVLMTEERPNWISSRSMFESSPSAAGSRPVSMR
jgi:5-methylcytosine-specific restriction enzyme subunit McrC